MASAVRTDDRTVIEQIIRRLRARADLFGDRIAGMSSASQWSERRAQDMPFAFVMPTGTTVTQFTGGPRTRGNHMLSNAFQVRVFICGAGDIQNQKAATSIEIIQDEVMSSLIGWEPTNDYFPMRFVRMDVGSQSAEYSEWVFSFEVSREWCKSSGDVGLTQYDQDVLDGRAPPPAQLDLSKVWLTVSDTDNCEECEPDDENRVSFKLNKVTETCPV